jgi:hypothetical protein
VSASKEASGGNNSFYDIPEWVKNADDLNEYLKSTGPLSNIVKSLFSNIGSRHAGTSLRRDAKKILHYAVRHLLWVDREGNEDKSADEVAVIAELISELSLEKKTRLLKEICGGE